MVKIAGICVSTLALLAGCSSLHDHGTKKIIMRIQPAVAGGPNGKPCSIGGPITDETSRIATVVSVAVKQTRTQSPPVNIAVTGSGKLIVIADPPPEGIILEPGVTAAEPPTRGDESRTNATTSSSDTTSQPTADGPPQCTVRR